MASLVKELDKLNPTQHMATRTGKMARDNPLCSGKKFFHTRNLLLTKLVRPRWWILASFFLFLRLCRLRPHLGIQTNKTVIIQYSAILTLVNNLGISTIMQWWLHCSLHGIYTTSLVIASGLTLWVALLIKQRFLLLQAQLFWKSSSLSLAVLFETTLLTDVQPPSIQCPSDMESTTEFGRPYARVTWEVPDPTDNSDEPLRLSGLLPPQALNVGKKHITYTATDSAGLSKSCTFSIVIKGTNDSKL